MTSRLDALGSDGPPASKRRRRASSSEPSHAPDEWPPPVAQASARPTGGTDPAAASADVGDDDAGVYSAFALGATFISRLAVDEAFGSLCARFGRDGHKFGIYADGNATITPALNLQCNRAAHNSKFGRQSQRCFYVRLSARSGCDLDAWSVVLFDCGLNEPGPSSRRRGRGQCLRAQHRPGRAQLGRRLEGLAESGAAACVDRR